MASTPTRRPKTAGAMSAAAEIQLVAGRELRTHLLKKSSVISTMIMLAVAVLSIVAYSIFGGGSQEPYRMTIVGSNPQVTTAIESHMKQVTVSGMPVSIAASDANVDALAPLLCDEPEDEAARIDALVNVGSTPVALLVCEDVPSAVNSGLTAALQESALAQEFTRLGGTTTELSAALNTAIPQVTALEPSSSADEAFGARYIVLMAINILLFIVILGGGSAIAMGVVEEKSSRIVEILLACVRPTSLLAGKVIGIGTAVIVSYGLIGLSAGITAAVTGVLPTEAIPLDAVIVMALVWMVVGFAFYAVLFGAAGALVSRQEDIGNVTMPLMLLAMAPYFASIMLASDPNGSIWRILSYIPPLSIFLMPARLVFGVSSWMEQGIAVALCLVVIPLLVKLGAVIYTRAVMRMGSRVKLREVLRRS
ncbi:ABC transporter permease [Schaalia vaccimaxillae]|uniref:ABC transporter permease n=1 Tax=Schaalia vaccimaxillae TaxID=183916 RepID=UPI0003B31645|nr:ABC transporter permease [Schaalia vaccimaxillae]